MPQRSFVGFGFGPIQSGLFLCEASRSARFGTLTVAEIDPDLIDTIRANDGAYALNIAHPDRIETLAVRGVQMLNPRVPGDRQRLVEAIREADELATALPSVRFYIGDDASVVALLTDALRNQPTRPQVLYTAENHNHAAEILTSALRQHLPDDALRHFQALNTVIGKMSGIVDDPEVIARLGLSTITPDSRRAILVEQFNRILVSKITLPGFERGITAFEEKRDLLPFEEAKLYGHNAIHALMGYLAHERGLVTMDQAGGHRDILATARSAFLDESGVALVKKYHALHDPLFTTKGFETYAKDLLERMTNPFLNDRVDRVIRDPERKLGWNDRLFGAMRLVLGQGIEPRHLARGTAAAVRYLPGQPPQARPALAERLTSLWPPDADRRTVDRLVDLTWTALQEQP